MSRPTVEQFQGMCDEIIEAAERLRRDGPELLRRAQRGTRDGYPTSSRGHEGGASTVLDDEGMPMPALSDPVGELVVNGVAADPVRSAVAVMVHELHQAVARVRAADGHRARSLPPETDEPTDGCEVCARYGVWSPVHKAGRCRADYEWRRRHGGVDAPEQVVLEREGRRSRRRGA